MWTAGHIRRWITLQVCPSRIRRHICWWSQELRQVMLRLLVEDDSMIWCGLDNYILWRQKKSFPAHACVIVLSQKLERQKFDILNMQICDTEGGSNQLHFLVWDKVATVLFTIMNMSCQENIHQSIMTWIFGKTYRQSKNGAFILPTPRQRIV